MRFVKMQGVGNDFVVVAAEDAEGRDLPMLAQHLCARGFGIGADGLLIVGRGTGEFAFTFRMFNPDGSEDMCGNGMRCACLLAYEQGWIGTDAVLASTKDGPRRCRLLSISGDRKQAMVEVEMGVPRFDPIDLPFISSETLGPIYAALDVNGRLHRLLIVNTGSTHSVIFGEGPPDDQVFLADSPLIENHPKFPERTSVLWAWRTGEDRFSVRIWERGAGETLGCGTGACAVGVAAQLKGLIESGVETVIASKGGELRIQWAGLPEGFKKRMPSPDKSAPLSHGAAFVPNPEPMHFFDPVTRFVQIPQSDVVVNTPPEEDPKKTAPPEETIHDVPEVLMTGPAVRVFEGDFQAEARSFGLM